jgi:predicted DNA-binding transcriptional regulator AlpA
LNELAAQIAAISARVDAVALDANTLRAESARSTVPQQNPGEASFSVDEFCARHNMSRSTFYALQRTEQGPRYMKIGRRVRITLEAEQLWCRKMEIPQADRSKDGGA